MPYTAQIRRDNPTCILVLVDQSGSMAAPFGAVSGKTKAQGVADAINRLLWQLVDPCVAEQGYHDYYHIGVVGYGEEIGIGFPGDLAGEVSRPISQIGEKPLRMEKGTENVEDGAGDLVESVYEFPVWFEPVAAGKTPMCQALQIAHQVIVDFVSEHPHCFPPIVINISDGRATDGDPAPWATALRRAASSDGNALLFNLHISERGERPILFPTSEAELPDEYARALFRMSSPLPPQMLRNAQIAEASVAEGARGFAFNADLGSVIMFLDIGTKINTLQS